MTIAKLDYTATEKEFMAFIYAINKFHHYIIGYPVTHVHIDHSAIKYPWELHLLTNILSR